MISSETFDCQVSRPFRLRYAMVNSFPNSDMSREICKICYHVNPVGYTVPDELWQTVIPHSMQRHVVCLTCFARLADEALIAWDDDIKLYPVSMASHLGSDTNPHYG